MAEAGGGRIVNIASTASVQAWSLQTAYGASKGAVALLTKNMAVELAPLGIAVNAIGPGTIDTPLAVNMTGNQAWADHDLSRTPAGRWGTPDDIAVAVRFLLRDAQWLTGPGAVRRRRVPGHRRARCWTASAATSRSSAEMELGLEGRVVHRRRRRRRDRPVDRGGVRRRGRARGRGRSRRATPWPGSQPTRAARRSPPTSPRSTACRRRCTARGRPRAPSTRSCLCQTANAEGGTRGGVRRVVRHRPDGGAPAARGHPRGAARPTARGLRHLVGARHDRRDAAPRVLDDEGRAARVDEERRRRPRRRGQCASTRWRPARSRCRAATGRRRGRRDPRLLRAHARRHPVGPHGPPGGGRARWSSSCARDAASWVNGATVTRRRRRAQGALTGGAGARRGHRPHLGHDGGHLPEGGEGHRRLLPRALAGHHGDRRGAARRSADRPARGLDNELAAALGAAALGFGAGALYFVALQHGQLSVVSPIVATQAAAAALAAALLLDEPLGAALARRPAGACWSGRCSRRAGAARPTTWRSCWRSAPPSASGSTPWRSARRRTRSAACGPWSRTAC